MKNTNKLLTSIVAVASLASFMGIRSAGAVNLNSDKKKISYAIGQQIAQNFKAQNVEIDVDALAESIKDGIEGKKIAMTQEEMGLAMQKLQGIQQDKMKSMGEKNKSEGEAFLAANKSKEGVQTTKSGLQYKVLQAGKGENPKKTDTVVAHYKGTFIDGKEFDSSYKRGEPAEFPVMGVIPGWTESLLTMKSGEKRQLFIPANLAYGEMGRPGIPPNSTLLFDIELVSIKKAEKAAKAPSAKAASTKAPTAAPDKKK